MPLVARAHVWKAVAPSLMLSCGSLEGGQRDAELHAGGSTGELAAPANQGASGASGAVLDAEAARGGPGPADDPASDVAPNIDDRQAHELADFARCGDAELMAWLAAACSASAEPPAILASGGVLPEGSISLLELVGSDAHRAAVRFEPEHSETYAIYLGTPNVPLSISTSTAQVEPRCARYLAPDFSRRLTGDDCSHLRGVYLVTLRAGVSHTLSFGPIAPEKWVRLYAHPASR